VGRPRPSAEFDLAGSNILACALEDLPGARERCRWAARTTTGIRPLARPSARGAVNPDRHHRGEHGGGNFLVFAALLEPGDDVLVSVPVRPRSARTDVRRADDPLRSPGDSGFALDPDRVRHA
jgi:hypothetical protein